MSPAIPPLHRSCWAPPVVLGSAGGAGLRRWRWAAPVALGSAGRAGPRRSCWAPPVALGRAGRAGPRRSCWAPPVVLGSAGRSGSGWGSVGSSRGRAGPGRAVRLALDCAGRARVGSSAPRGAPVRVDPPTVLPACLPDFLPSLLPSRLPCSPAGSGRRVRCRPVPPGFAGPFRRLGWPPLASLAPGRAVWFRRAVRVCWFRLACRWVGRAAPVGCGPWSGWGPVGGRMGRVADRSGSGPGPWVGGSVWAGVCPGGRSGRRWRRSLVRAHPPIAAAAGPPARMAAAWPARCSAVQPLGISGAAL
jgi:hypothetical protein